MDFELERARTAGEILSDGLELFFQRFWLFAALALVTVVPLETALALWRPELIDWNLLPSTQLLPDWDALLVVELVGIFIVYPVSAATTAVAVALLGAGGQPAVPEILRRSLPVLPAVIGTTLVVMLATLGGFVFLIVPGIWLGVLLAVACQAAAIEKTGVIDSARRSVELVRGRFWSSFKVLLLITVVFVAFALVAFFIVEALSAVSWLYIAATILVDALFYSATDVIWALLFFSWRASRPAEGSEA